MSNIPHQVRRIVQDLSEQKSTSENLFGAIYGQIAILILMTAVVFAAVMFGVEFSKETHVVDGNLVTGDNTAVSVNTLKTTQGLMYMTTIPTDAFSQINSMTIVFDKKGAWICCNAMR